MEVPDGYEAVDDGEIFSPSDLTPRETLECSCIGFLSRKGEVYFRGDLLNHKARLKTEQRPAPFYSLNFVAVDKLFCGFVRLTGEIQTYHPNTSASLDSDLLELFALQKRVQVPHIDIPITPSLFSTS